MAYNTLAALLSQNKVDTVSFALPIDFELCRSLPSALGPRPGSEGLIVDAAQPQLAIPPDLVVRDWQKYMGKTLNRGFDTPAAIKRALELLNAQFTRHAPVASMASALGVYANAAGDHQAALAWHAEALKDQTNHPLFLKRMASAMLNVDPQDRVARVLLERAASLAPEQVLFQAELAHCLFQQGATDEGYALMRDAARIHDVLPEVPYLAAWMKRKLKQSDDEALELIDLALTAAPHVRRFAVFRLHILVDLGRADAANQGIDEIIARYGIGGDIKALRSRNAA